MPAIDLLPKQKSNSGAANVAIVETQKRASANSSLLLDAGEALV
jgi:hypothetical protein